MSAVFREGKWLMDEDTVKELLLNNQENFKKVFAILESVVSGLSKLESRVAALEAKDAITKPLWQEMRADQQHILNVLQEHGARMDRIETRMSDLETHLQQQDEKIARIDEKLTVGFRKLGDKFDLLAQDYYDLHADVVDLNRRVTQLEPVN